MTIESDAGRQVIRFKERVVNQSTQVFIENLFIDIGDIQFRVTAKTTFYFKNSGDYPLALSSNVLEYFENDLNVVKFKSPDDSLRKTIVTNTLREQEYKRQLYYTILMGIQDHLKENPNLSDNLKILKRKHVKNTWMFGLTCEKFFTQIALPISMRLIRG